MSASAEIDHIFIAASPGAHQLDACLLDLVREGSRNVHPGQGTANRRFFFQDMMLEFIWLADPAAAQQGIAGRMALARRLVSEADGPAASPFGICLRLLDEAASPFAAWPYQPDYLAGADPLYIGANASLAHEPLLFYMPRGRHPGLRSDSTEPRRHPAGWRQATSLTLAQPLADPISAVLDRFRSLELMALEDDPAPLLTVEFDYGTRGQARDCRPHFPLLIRW